MTRRKSENTPGFQKNLKIHKRLHDEMVEHCDGMCFEWAIMCAGIYVMLHKMDANGREAMVKEMEAYVVSKPRKKKPKRAR